MLNKRNNFELNVQSDWQNQNDTLKKMVKRRIMVTEKSNGADHESYISS
jgi:hypothetical protein